MFQIGLGATVVYLACLGMPGLLGVTIPSSALVAYDVLSGIFNGIRIATMLLALAHVLSKCSQKQAAVLIPLGFAGAHGLFLVTYLVPELFHAFFLIVLIALAALLVFLAQKYISLPQLRQQAEPADFTERARTFGAQRSEQQVHNNKDESRQFWLILKSREYTPLFFGMLVFPFFYGITAQICSYEEINAGLFDITSEAGSILIMLLLAFFKPSQTSRFDQIISFSIISAIFAAALLLSPLLWNNEVFVSGLLIKFAYMVFVTLMWVSLQKITHGSPDRSYFFFGIALGTYHFCSTMGRLIIRLFADTMSLSSDLIATLSLGAVWVLSMVTLGILLLSRSKKATVEAAQSSLSYEDACEKFAELYNLSAREKETIQEFARGRTMSHIAKNLLISEESVKSYVKRSYVKASCHSRQDLIDKIEHIRAGESPPPPGNKGE